MKLHSFLGSIVLIIAPLYIHAISIGSDSVVSVESHYTFTNSTQVNEMLGFGLFKNGFALADASTTCTFKSIFPVSGNISLHGGQLVLGSDLIFGNMTNLETSGVFYSNGCIVDLSGSITGIPSTHDTLFHNSKLQLNNEINFDGAIDFQGNCVINGRGNTINLDVAADVKVHSGSTLTFCNVNLDGLSVRNLRCLADDASIIFQNCRIMLARDYIFDKGHLGFKEEVFLSGTVKFSYASAVTSTVYANALLALDSGVTFSYNPGSPRKDLICFENECSMLYLDGATLVSTPTGIVFTKGCIFIDQQATMYAKSFSYTNGSIYTGGISFGKNNAEDDCNVTILTGATLKINQGELNYRNASASSWNMISPTSVLHMKSGSNLILDQTLTLGNGKIQASYTSFLRKKSGASLVGDVEIVAS